MYRDILEINKREISPYRHGYTAPTSKPEKTRLTIKILVRVKRKASRLYVVIAREFPTMMGKAKAWGNTSKTYDGERDEPGTSEVVFITALLYRAKKFQGST